MDSCLSPLDSRRRIFWTTQPEACGVSVSGSPCYVSCGQPGLELVTEECGTYARCDPLQQPNCRIDPRSIPKTFATNDWVRSLMINILMTDGRRPETECGYRPGAKNGHWSESFMEPGDANRGVGTLLRYIEPTGSVRESMLLIKEYARDSLQKLVHYGVAVSVDVEAEYAGNNNVNLIARVVGHAGETSQIGVSGTRSKNAWVWK